jgi:hypothetical protein
MSSAFNKDRLMLKLDSISRQVAGTVGLAGTLLAGAAMAADNAGKFAISGAGALTCAAFVSAHDDDPERYRLFGSWMSGFFTGFNAIKDETYDIIPWHSPDLIASVIYRHCQDNADQSFAAASMSVAQQLLPQRIQALSDKVAIPAGADQPASLYKVVVERVQTSLHDQGFYQGDVDGAVGSQTAEAVLDFQKANDLEETGKLDQITLWRLLQKP